MKADSRLYKTADGRVVREGDPDAAFLYRRPGQPIPDSVAEELGMKARKPAQNKKRSAARNK